MSIGIALDNCLVSSFLEKYNIRGMGKFGIENIWIGEFLTFGLQKK